MMMSRPPAEHTAPCAATVWLCAGRPAGRRCDMRAIEELRCPECGHQQPTGVLHARAIRGAATRCTPAFADELDPGARPDVHDARPMVFFGTSGGSLCSSGIGGTGRLCIMAWCHCSLLPMRLLVMHWRLVWLGSLSRPCCRSRRWSLGVGLQQGSLGRIWGRFGSSSCPAG